MNRPRTGLGFASPGGDGDYFEEYGASWEDLFYDALDWGYNPYEAAFFADNSFGGGGGADSNSLWQNWYDFYLGMGYSPGDAADLADIESDGSDQTLINIESERCRDRWSAACLPQIPDNLPGVIPAPYDPTSIPLPELFANDPAPKPPMPSLPGYCPGGYYHPRTDPYKCVPFPDDSKPAARKQAQQRAQQQQQQAQRRQQQMQQPCPTGQVRYPYTGKCVPQQCPQGTRRNPATGECVKDAQQGQLPQCPTNRVYDLKKKACVVPGSSSGSSNSWLWLLLIAGGAVVISKRRS